MSFPEPDGIGGWVWEGTVAAQLGAAGVLRYLTPVDVTDKRLTALSAPHQARIIQMLTDDPRFARGSLHHLHPEVGKDRRDFRAYLGDLGDRHKGSLQIVIDATTGNFYADLDLWNPYQDTVNWVGHAGEVVAGWWRRVWR